MIAGIGSTTTSFTWVLGIQTWVLRLVQQALYWLDHLPDPRQMDFCSPFLTVSTFRGQASSWLLLTGCFTSFYSQKLLMSWIRKVTQYEDVLLVDVVVT